MAFKRFRDADVDHDVLGRQLIPTSHESVGASSRSFIARQVVLDIHGGISSVCRGCAHGFSYYSLSSRMYRCEVCDEQIRPQIRARTLATYVYDESAPLNPLEIVNEHSNDSFELTTNQIAGILNQQSRIRRGELAVGSQGAEDGVQLSPFPRAVDIDDDDDEESDWFIDDTEP